MSNHKYSRIKYRRRTSPKALRAQDDSEYLRHHHNAVPGKYKAKQARQGVKEMRARQFAGQAQLIFSSQAPSSQMLGSKRVATSQWVRGGTWWRKDHDN